MLLFLPTVDQSVVLVLPDRCLAFQTAPWSHRDLTRPLVIETSDLVMCMHCLDLQNSRNSELLYEASRMEQYSNCTMRYQTEQGHASSSPPACSSSAIILSHVLICHPRRVGMASSVIILSHLCSCFILMGLVWIGCMSWGCYDLDCADCLKLERLKKKKKKASNAVHALDANGPSSHNFINQLVLSDVVITMLTAFTYHMFFLVPNFSWFNLGTFQLYFNPFHLDAK